MNQKRLTVALDLAKKTHVGRILDTTTGEMSQAIDIPVNEAGFAQFEAILAGYSGDPEDFLIGCEATGHYGETLLRRLQNQSYDIVRFNPAQVVQFRRGLGRKAKTDALDADVIARQLAVVDVVIEEKVHQTQRALQRMTRLRLDFVEEQGRWVNRVRGLLNQVFPELEFLLKKLLNPTSLAILTHFPTPRQVGEATLEEMGALLRQASHGQKGVSLAQAIKRSARHSVGLSDPWLETELNLCTAQLVVVSDNIKKLEGEIERLTEQLLTEYSDQLGLAEPLTIASFPNGTHLSLGTILAEIGAVERFQSLKQLLSYFGWCPNTRESGASQSPHPKMSRQGNRFLRRMLWMLSLSAVRFVPEYQVYYQRRLAAGKNKMKTLVAVGRKLLSVIFAILRTGIPYDPERYLKHQPASK